MKLPLTIKCLVLTGLVAISQMGYAYDDDKPEERCKNPKIQEFTLPVYETPSNKEVPPETEFSFVVSGWANPKKFLLNNGKGVDIPFRVESKETYHKIYAKLPAEFTGKFIRINARIPALLGCYTTIGWLIKVADKPKETAPPPTPASTEANASSVASPAAASSPATGSAPASSAATAPASENQSGTTPATVQPASPSTAAEQAPAKSP